MKSLKLAFRNLMRMKRRTILTSILIAIGVLFVVLFSAFSGSFKNYMISQITDSMLGHIQIHRKGYVAGLDSMPLDKNLSPKVTQMIEERLKNIDEIEAISKRLKLNVMVSNFETSTNMRLNGINPIDENRAMPLFKDRVDGDANFKEGEVLIPKLISKGMRVNRGDVIVIVATNKQGSVNALTLKVAGVVEPISGPGGRDGYIHIKDAEKLLRVKGEINEIAIRLSSIEALEKVDMTLNNFTQTLEKPKLEVHSWKKLSPFSNIANMIDIMSLSIKIILIAIVLVAILNVMIMSVYERVKEIGTMSAMGVKSSFIVKLFVNEGLILGIFGFIVGLIVSFAVIFGIGDITIAFGRQDDLILSPNIALNEIAIIGVLVIIISILASLYPAFKASKLNPVDALRG